MYVIHSNNTGMPVFQQGKWQNGVKVFEHNCIGHILVLVPEQKSFPGEKSTNLNSKIDPVT